MRLDGATKAAPHTYVEALMKRVTYPRLAGFVEFGRFHRNIERGYSSVAIVVSIHNLSEYIHERNLHLRLSSLTGHILKYNGDIPALIRPGCDYRQKAADYLYYGIPHIEQFILVLGHENTPYTVVQLNLDILGDSSPTLRSAYEFGFGWEKTDNGGETYSHRLMWAKENFYLHEVEDEFRSEQEKIKLKNHFEINKFNAWVHNHPLFK